MQALLNYAIAVLAARMTRVLIAKGYDPAFGFLHDGRKAGRLSFVWDCIEPHRPELVRAVFGYASNRVFRKADFAVFEGGIIRLSAPIAREVAALAIKIVSVRDMVKTVNWVTGLF
jgi:CRISPR/Cas system-associated endonuclease Cas1